MEKPAVTSLDIHPLIKSRWSPRAFKTREVEAEKLRRIFEAARWAPSSFNEQPWRFIVGSKGGDTWDKLYGCLIDFNQKWNHNVPVLLMSVGKKTLTRNGRPNAVFHYDVGQSMAYITLQAVSEGLMVHQMGGFSKERARGLFRIPDDFEPLTMMAIGYQDEASVLPSDLEQQETAPRQRKPARDLVFSGNFGESGSLTASH